MKKIATLICMTVIATGCSTTSTPSNPMLHHSESARAYSDSWDEGNEQFTEGQALIAEGKAQIKEGEENLEKGRAMVEEGSAKMKASETGFDKLVNKQPVKATTESGTQAQGVE